MFPPKPVRETPISASFTTWPSFSVCLFLTRTQVILVLGPILLHYDLILTNYICNNIFWGTWGKKLIYHFRRHNSTRTFPFHLFFFFALPFPAYWLAFMLLSPWSGWLQWSQASHRAQQCLLEEEWSSLPRPPWPADFISFVISKHFATYVCLIQSLRRGKDHSSWLACSSGSQICTCIRISWRAC